MITTVRRAVSRLTTRTAPITHTVPVQAAATAEATRVLDALGVPTITDYPGRHRAGPDTPRHHRAPALITDTAELHPADLADTSTGAL